MRLIQLALPANRLARITDTLDDAGIDHLVTDEHGTGQYDHIVSFVVPTQAVESVLDDLRSVGLSDSDQVIVLDVETIISTDYDELAEEYDADDQKEDRIAREELKSQASALTPSTLVYGVLTLISAVVATAGLLLDSPAVVVGSMVIAPLIGPALSASVGTVINDGALFREGFLYQVYGVAVAVLGAAVFAAFIRYGMIVPAGTDVLVIDEVSERLEPDLLSLFIALGAGIAGILSLTTGVSTALVGVMIAAALIPPAAAAGIAMAWGEPFAAIGAGVLVLVNLVSINLMGLLTLWFSGYRPRRYVETSMARRQFLQQVGAYGVAVGVLSTFLIGTTVTSTRHSRFEAQARSAIVTQLESDPFAELTLIDLVAEYGERPILADPTRVVVDVGTATDSVPSGLADSLADSIATETGHEVEVDVRIVRLETSH